MEQATILKEHVGSWMLSSRPLQRRKGMFRMEQGTMYIQPKHAKMEVQPSLLIDLKTVYTAFLTGCTCEKAL